MLILVGNYLNNAYIIKKEASKMLSWAMNTYYANIPLDSININDQNKM